MDKQVTAILALVGALTGCSALGWDIYKWRRQATSLKLTVATGMKMVTEAFRAQKLVDRKIEGDYAIVRVANRRGRKTTLQALAWRSYETRWKRFRHKPSQVLISLDLKPDALPYELAEGEVWHTLIEIDENLRRCLTMPIAECFVEHATNDKPVVCRVHYRRA